MVEIKFTNHAGFIIQDSRKSIAIDPWIEGTAFDNSWSLLSETPREVIKMVQDSNFIWFSHEHPDHFSPANIKKYFSGNRFVFQKTADRRVAKFLESTVGKNNVIEVGFGEEFDIDEGFSITTYPYGSMDSWCIIKVSGNTILNLNDCNVLKDDEIEFIKNTSPHIDVLFIQFSYASGESSESEIDYRIFQANEKMDSIRRIIDEIRPKFVIPFASFVYFSHEENFYVNDEINKIDKVMELLNSSDTPSTPVCLYPGDVWDLEKEWNNTESVNKYMNDYENIKIQTRTKTYGDDNIFELNKLFDAGRLFLKKIHKNNPLWRYYYQKNRELYGVNFDIYDIGVLVHFDFKDGFTYIENEGGNDDVKISAESISNLFSRPWGYDSLHVGGRYEAGPSARKKLDTIFNIPTLNNQGFYFDKSYLTRAILQKFRKNVKYNPYR